MVIPTVSPHTSGCLHGQTISENITLRPGMSTIETHVLPPVSYRMSPSTGAGLCAFSTLQQEAMRGFWPVFSILVVLATATEKRRGLGKVDDISEIFNSL